MAQFVPVFSTTSPLKMYDIFKNTVSGGDVTKIEQLLANLAVGDTSHDIDKKDKGVAGITDKLEEPRTIEAKMYKEGIPIPYTVIPSEATSVSSVISNATFEWVVPNPPPPSATYHNENFKSHNYVPLEIMKYIKEGKLPTGANNSAFVKPNLTKHKFNTQNDNKYVVTYFDVKPEGRLIDAKTFFTNMGYNPDTATTRIPKNIAFVVDCTSVKIEQILNTGPRLGSNFNTYLIKSPEGENDPGGKTNLQSSTFKEYKDNIPKYDLNPTATQ